MPRETADSPPLIQLPIEGFHAALKAAAIDRAFVVSRDGRIECSHQELEPLREFFDKSPDFAAHEGIFIGRDPAFETLFLAAVHDTRRGLAQGGLRFKPYSDVAALLSDGLRLARGMTRKSALAGLWWGGGKGIIPITDALRNEPEIFQIGSPRRNALFEAYGRFVASLNGIYYTAEDIGTKTADMNAILRANRFVTCVGVDRGGSGNPSPFTSRGVFRAIQAGWNFVHGTDDLAGVTVAIQGIGNVGGPLAELLHQAGARLILSDIDRQALIEFTASLPGATWVEPHEIFDAAADIFAPCAIGAQVNASTIPRLKVKLVCGAANNILAEAADAERLQERGIVFVPDYVANRMGIVNCADEWQGHLPEDVEKAADRVYPDSLRVLEFARAEGLTPSAAADRLADEAAAIVNPLMGHRGRRLIDHLIASDWHLQS